MEQLPILPEMVQYGVIGLCVAMIAANVYIIKVFVGAILKLYEKIDALNATINELNTSVELLCVRTRRRKRPTQSGVINTNG